MKFWSKNSGRDSPSYAPSGHDEELRRRAFKRVGKITTEGLLTWGDAACSAMGKAFMDWREQPNLESVAEIAAALFTLEAVAYELKLRTVDRST